LHLFDLRPPRELDPAEKADMPVSIVVMPDGTVFVVSRHKDVVWEFYPYIPQENLPANAKQIDWRIRLPDGRLLTDPEHAPLLESAKDFIWSLFVQPVEGRTRPTMYTLVLKVRDLVPLLRWMVQAGLPGFADLTGRTLDYVPTARRKADGSKAAEANVTSRLIVVEDLYLQHNKLVDALPGHPWPHETAGSLAGIKYGVAHRKPRTELISDAIATHIAEAALDYVRKRSAGILDALESVALAAEAKEITGCCSTQQSRARIAAARAANYKGANDLAIESIRLRTACYIVIDEFSGIRVSEMMSLEEGCIVPGRSRDGCTDILWLHGTIYKTGIRPKRWLVPPIVREAVEVLTSLTAPLRERLRQEEILLTQRITFSITKEKARLVKRLHTVRTQKDKLFLAKKRSSEACVLSGHAMSCCLKAFCADLGIRGEDNQPYPLHSHQFRRTYARFIARSELGDLLTLRDHFGHWSIDMTVYYADGGADEYESDTELLEMVAEEKMMRQNEIMGSYLDSDAPLGNGGWWIKQWRASVRTASNKEDLIAEYAGSLTLTGTGHSWCVGTERGTCCGGLCVFEPQMCVDCNHGMIGPEHRSVWQGIRDQQLEALALDDMGPGGQARAKEIISNAEKVLRRLDGQEAA
jgi:integrase